MSSLGELILPFAPGARVEVELEALTLVCRLQGLSGRQLKLSAPTLHRPRPEPESAAHLVVFSRGGCVEAPGKILHWVLGRPPVLVVEPQAEWVEGCRRMVRRIPRSLDAELVVGETSFPAQTQDVSADGLSLHAGGRIPLEEGERARVRLRLGSRWTAALPVTVMRKRRWLGLGEPIVEIGAQLGALSPEHAIDWQACLSAVDLGD